MKLRYLLRVVVMVYILFAVFTPAVVRADSHYSHELDIGIFNGDSVSWQLSSGDGIYGDFEVTYPASGDDQIITFGILDEENYDLWILGQPAVGYHRQDDVESYSFTFRIPYTDKWYFVFWNYALLTSKTIQFDLYRDTTPPDIDMNLDAGATYSGTKSITAIITEATFDIEEVKLYIDGSLKTTGYGSLFSYSWDTTQYSNGAHTVRILASDNVGNSGYEEVSVQVSNGVLPIAGLGDTTPLLFLGVFGLVAIVALVIIISRRRKGPPPVGVIPSVPPSFPSEN